MQQQRHQQQQPQSTAAHLQVSAGQPARQQRCWVAGRRSSQGPRCAACDAAAKGGSYKCIARHAAAAPSCNMPSCRQSLPERLANDGCRSRQVDGGNDAACQHKRGKGKLAGRPGSACLLSARPSAAAPPHHSAPAGRSCAHLLPGCRLPAALRTCRHRARPAPPPQLRGKGSVHAAMGREPGGVNHPSSCAACRYRCPAAGASPSRSRAASCGRLQHVSFTRGARHCSKGGQQHPSWLSTATCAGTMGREPAQKLEDRPPSAPCRRA